MSEGRLDHLLAPLDRWRFGDAMPLRLMGASHALALSGRAPELAEVYPSCGGTVPEAIATSLAESVLESLGAHPDHTADFLHRAVQTNETGRASALVLGLSALAASVGDGAPISLVEVGTSAGLNLRMDRFAYLDGESLIGGDANSPVRLSPEWVGGAPGLHPWLVADRVGVDPHPADPSDPTVALRLRSYLWPDQTERRARLDGAIALAGEVPAELVQTDGPMNPNDTAATLAGLLAERAGIHPTMVFQSIMWQYVPTAARWPITRAIEEAGERATEAAPLVRVTFEPDEFRRDRVAVQLRRWPGGSGTLLAHADYHGRWVQPLP
ncbi:MAG: DUF2332 domain-containing protein [Microthrixaceae bacterium]